MRFEQGIVGLSFHSTSRSGDNVDKSRTPKATPNDQVKAFRKAAHALGCDDNEERFKETLRTVAKAKPHPQESKKATK